MENLSPVEGERISESPGLIWAGLGVAIFCILFGGALAWAWWTQFPLYETEEVRAITPDDQWQMRKARKIGEKEYFELPEAPRHPVPVKTQHVLGFTYGVLGMVMTIVGVVGIPFAARRFFIYLVERPTLIIGKNCFQLVVRDQLVRIHIPYSNIKEVGLMKDERTGKAICVGVNLRDLNDPTMHYQNAARSKKWTGWDYAIGNKELFAVPTAQIYQQLQQAMTQAQEEFTRSGRT